MTTPTSPGVLVQLAVHRAVRRDAARLSTALAEGRVPSAEAVRAFWADMSFQLHHHHQFEDTCVWPLVRERLGGRVHALLDRNLDEHEAMGEAMARFDAVVSAEALDPALARAAAEQMRTAIETHLDNEEADVLPLLAEALTPEDYLVLQAEGGKGNPPDAFLPWVLDDAADETLAFFGRLPEPVNVQLEAAWAPRRKTLIEALSA